MVRSQSGTDKAVTQYLRSSTPRVVCKSGSRNLNPLQCSRQAKAILPAGTAHKRLEASPDFLVVGAYPQWQEKMDLIRDQPEEQAAAEERIAAVTLPQSDPVYGSAGPLQEHWGTT